MAEEQIQQEMASQAAPPRRWLTIATILFLCATVLSVAALIRERRYALQLDARNAEINADLTRTRTQLDALTAKLNAMSATAASPTEPQAAQVGPESRPVRRRGVSPARRSEGQARAHRRVTEDPRWKQIQAELAEHQKEIQSTQQKLDQARSELESNLKSAREELGTSIAKTHEELVALEKKGERNYYEFDLTKTKSFQHAGPLGLSLRKTNPKKRYYDMVVMVEDSPLNKKHISLYEPVFFYPSDSRQPIELVVNRIDKYRVHGYVSEPKYKPSEVAVSGSSAVDTSSSAKAEKPEAEATLTHRPESPQ